MPGLEEDSVVRQEIHCHNCNRYVQFDLDLAINGNHVLSCPNCGHEHCRVVTNGNITEGRWDTRNNQWFGGTTYTVSNATIMTSVYTVAATTSTITYVYGSYV